MDRIRRSLLGKPKMERREDNPLWMQTSVKHPGALHKALHVSMDKKIPLSKLEKAKKSHSPLMKKRASLAMTFRRFNKGEL